MEWSVGEKNEKKWVKISMNANIYRHLLLIKAFFYFIEKISSSYRKSNTRYSPPSICQYSLNRSPVPLLCDTINAKEDKQKRIASSGKLSAVCLFSFLSSLYLSLCLCLCLCFPLFALSYAHKQIYCQNIFAIFIFKRKETKIWLSHLW